MKDLIFAAVYLVGSHLTGGYYYNHRCVPDAVTACRVHATLAGMGWPVYWSVRAAVEVTK